ncbi:hypothetical protein [Maribellus maritimus]|uniref:hypothetical protein n=1 Tax=Maribellus maritimus TaxID=2870838 RepID=UPI001EEB837E|nr:hypothetical protein [Maribellus maritimus]MCG6186522.1 hypothetical protein [Maribellus maritimus]
MKKIIFILFGVLFINISGFSQDIITKTTGEDIEAKVLEVDRTEIRYKRYSNLDGPIFTLQKSDILMIRYENGTKDIFNTRTESNTVSSRAQNKSFFGNENIERPTKWEGNGEGISPGSHFCTDIGFYAKTGDYGRNRIAINAIYMYQINPFLGLGFGTGIRAFTEEDVVLVPFYPSIKGYLLNNDVSPYLSLNIGYAVDISGNEQSGLNLSPKVGVFKRVSGKSVAYFEFGYEMQKLEFVTVYSSGNAYYSGENSGAICFNIGYTF